MKRLLSLLLFTIMLLTQRLPAQVIQAPGISESPTKLEGKATIVGQLRLKKPDGTEKPLSAKTVRLNIRRQNRVIAATAQTTDDQGNYRFTNLNPSEQLQYQLHSEFDEVPYLSPATSFQPGATEIRLDLNVFEHADDLSTLTIEVMQIALYAEEAQYLLECEETMFISNKTHVAFSAAEGLHLELPKRYFSPEIPPGVNYTLEENHIHIAKPIRPGEIIEVRVKFFLSRAFSSLEFQQELPLNVGRLGVFLFPQSMSINQGFRSMGKRQLNNIRYNVYVDDRTTAPNKQIEFTLKGIPGGFGHVEWLMLAAFVVVLTAGLLLVKREPSRDYPLLLRRLKILEQAYQSGSVDEKQYTVAKQQLMEKLIASKRQGLDDDST